MLPSPDALLPLKAADDCQHTGCGRKQQGQAATGGTSRPSRCVKMTAANHRLRPSKGFGAADFLSDSKSAPSPQHIPIWQDNQLHSQTSYSKSMQQHRVVNRLYTRNKYADPQQPCSTFHPLSSNKSSKGCSTLPRAQKRGRTHRLRPVNRFQDSWRHYVAQPADA